MTWYNTNMASKLNSMNREHMRVFDVETTGLDPDKDEILQLSVLDGYGKILFNEYFKPQHTKEWPEAEAKNHISYAMVKNKPTFSDRKEKIQKVFDNAELLIGFHVGFDINFITANGIKRCGKVFDLQREFRNYREDLYGDSRRPALCHCADFFGVKYEPHNSLEDARATLDCFNQLLQDPRFYDGSKTHEQYTITKSVDSPKEEQKKKKKQKGIKIPLIRIGIIAAMIGELLYYILNRQFIISVRMWWKDIGSIIQGHTTNAMHLVAVGLFSLGVLLILIGGLVTILRVIRWIKKR